MTTAPLCQGLCFFLHASLSLSLSCHACQTFFSEGYLLSLPRPARFFLTKYAKTGKKLPQHYLMAIHKIEQMALKYCKSPYNITTFLILMPYKITQIWLFWF
jgi:hypothetical protein